MTATEAETAPLTAGEIAALNAAILIKIRDRASLGAAVPPAPRAPGDGSRRPLGLAPADDDGHEAWTETPREPPLEPPPRRDPGDDRAAWLSDLDVQVFATGRFIGEELNDIERRARCRFDELRSEISELKLENARARALVAELKSQVSELAFVSERLRIEARGPVGERGSRGRDGPPGPRGERGSRGERGQAAPAVIEWRPDPEAFAIQAILADGSIGPMIALRSLFESYHAATSWVEDADLVEAARASRAQADAEAEAAARWEPR